jgi:DNA-binding NarL/FixJ family response regulator
MPRETDDVAEAVVRLVAAVGKRISTEDPDALVYLETIETALKDAFQVAVLGLREHGFSDADIGRELGVTRQAVAQRWPHVDGRKGGERTWH